MSLSGKRIAAGTRALLLSCLTLAAAALSAQTVDKMSLSGQNMKLSELFRQIEKQTGSIVVVNVSDTDTGKEIYIAGGEWTVGEILDRALDGTGHTYRRNGRYIIITPVSSGTAVPAVRAASPAAAAVPQPTQAEFENSVKDYTNGNLAVAAAPPRSVTVRYDTIRTERPHDGVFRYASGSFHPVYTGRPVKSPFSRNTPPAIAVKTNLVWAATLTPNLSAEIGLGKRTSLEISGGNNRWNLKGSMDNNRKLVHWVIKPEFRYWLCERFDGHFFGVHAFYGRYNVGGYDIPLLFDKAYRYEGEAWGGGVSYGYHWAFAKRWGLEFTAGVGAMRMDYVKNDCMKCGDETGSYRKTYVGPTGLGVKLVFVIK